MIQLEEVNWLLQIRLKFDLALDLGDCTVRLVLYKNMKLKSRNETCLPILQSTFLLHIK